MLCDLEAMKDYLQILNILANGNISEFEKLKVDIAEFPYGEDAFSGRYWIINAIDCGSMKSIKWMLKKGVNLDFRDDEGCTPILSAIDRDKDDRLEIIRLLIEYGAPLNKKGFNDYTPLHLAAARDDVTILKILVEAGADLSIKTEIDEYATALEEAKFLKRRNAQEYLENIT